MQSAVLWNLKTALGRNESCFHVMPASKPVLIDTDPGLDDLLALVLALRSPVLDVRAITVVAGNVSVDACTANALRILEAAGVEPPPVFRGCAEPISPPVTRAEHVHGADGIGGVSEAWPVQHLQTENAHAVEAILDLARRHPGELTLITLGPLTNVAMALERDPAALANIREIVVMGGSGDGRGNVTSRAEFNFYADPYAARAVIRSGLPVTVVGLNVTEQTLLSRARFHERLASMEEGKLRRFLFDATGPYFDFAMQRRGRDACPLHDPLAVGAAMDPSLIRTQRMVCEVVDEQGSTRGMMTAEPADSTSDAPTVQVAMEVAAERFLELFLEVVYG